MPVPCPSALAGVEDGLAGDVRQVLVERAADDQIDLSMKIGLTLKIGGSHTGMLPRDKRF